MARSGYEPEIKASMGTSRPGRVNTSPSRGGGESPADRLRDKARGIAEGSAQDTKIDAQPANQVPLPPPKMQMQPGNMPSDMHHIAAATSIAHAILGRRPGGM